MGEPLLINMYATVVVLPEPRFPHRLHGRRDITDPELATHLDGFIGYVTSSAGQSMPAVTYDVVRHLRRVRHHLSLTVDERDLPDVNAWAESANAIYFLPDGTVRDPAGRTLAGRADRDGAAQVPFPADARARKARTEAQLSELGLRVPAALPPVVGQDEVSLREAADVAGRALALLVVALRAESLAIDDPFTVDDLRSMVPKAFPALSPRESDFISVEDPAEPQLIAFTWRYEALSVLEFAVGLIPVLPFPATICDVAGTVRVLKERGYDIVDGAALRPTSDILDALDLHLRLHWVARQARLDGQAPPVNLDPGVVQERHYALNWLVRFDDADWDDVDTPT